MPVYEEGSVFSVKPVKLGNSHYFIMSCAWQKFFGFDPKKDIIVVKCYLGKDGRPYAVLRKSEKGGGSVG